jgi:hypothetical protein
MAASRPGTRLRYLRHPLAAAAAVVLAAQAYQLLAAVLPEISPVRASLIVARTVGCAAIVGCVWATVVLCAGDRRRAWAIAAAGLVGVAVLNLADAGAAATPVEALAYGAVGLILAVGMLEPLLVLGLPVFVGVLDLFSTLFGGPSSLLGASHTKSGDPLSLETPDWGNGLPAGRLGFSDVVVAGLMLGWAAHYGMRVGATAVALWVALIIASVLGIELDTAIPVLPLMALAFFAANARSLPALMRAARQSS